MNRDDVKSLLEEAGRSFDGLVAEILVLVRSCGHTKATEEGVQAFVHTSVEAKADLIRKMISCPGYNGNLQIVRNVTFDREANSEAIDEFMVDISSTMLDKIIKSTDPVGQTMNEARNNIIANSPKWTDLAKLSKGKVSLSSVEADFEPSGIYKPSREKGATWLKGCNVFGSFREKNVNDTFYNTCNAEIPSVKGIAVGQKTSKAFRKLAVYAGIEDDSEFLAKFPSYSDQINSNSVHRLYVLSVNPLDFLQMSHGNTWSSCHTIDPQNTWEIRIQRGSSSYRGMHMGGTMSYACDKVSMVSYTVSASTDAEHPDTVGKIYRNMLHYNGTTLIQGRVYPQAMDGSTDLYTKFRLLAHETLCAMEGKEYINLHEGSDSWILKGKANIHGDYITNNAGAHYPDWIHYDGCTISYYRGKSIAPIDIGSHGVCLKCGRRISVNGSLTCCDC